MSQVSDWNTPGGGQATPPPQYGQPQPQYGQPPPQYGQANPQAMMAPAGYGMPGTAPQVSPGMYYDQASGLTLPNGTTLASPGLRIGAYFLAGVLWTVTLFIGYAIWGLITWGEGRTPTQQLLGLRCWKLQERAPASWGTMFLRGLGMAILDYIAFGGLVSFVMFLVNKDRRTLYDHLSGVVVLHDPNKVLSPVQAMPPMQQM
jgi:uncharacterized RDD family membrane protein YckC